MSGPIIPFSKEIIDFFRENKDNLEFLNPDHGAKDASGLKWTAGGGGTQLTLRENGNLEVALVTTLDDNKDASDGNLLQKDLFTLLPDGGVEYTRITGHNGQGDQASLWEKRAALFGVPQPKAQVLERMKKFVAEELVRKTEKLSEGYFSHLGGLSDSQQALYTDLQGSFAKFDPPKEIMPDHPNTQFRAEYFRGKLRLSIRYAVKKEGEKNPVSPKWEVMEIFTLDPESLELTDFERKYRSQTESRGVVLNSAKLSDEDQAKAKAFWEGMKPYFLEHGGLLFANYQEPSTVTEPEVGGQQHVIPPQNNQDLDILASVMSERISREADESKGWWNRLRGGEVLDAGKELGLFENVLNSLRVELQKSPKVSLLRVLAHLEIAGGENRVRNKMLQDPLVRQISNIAEIRDDETRANAYLNFVSKDLLAGHKFTSAAERVADIIFNNLPDTSKTREEAGLIHAELSPESGVRDWAKTVELGLPQFMPRATEPTMLASFAAGSLGGAAVEAAAFKQINQIGSLAGKGRIITAFRNILGVGTGIVAGEAPAFAGSHAVLSALHHDPELMLNGDRLVTEWKQMCLLFGALRAVHWGTGMVAKGLRSTENEWLKKLFHKEGGEAAMEIPMDPLGRPIGTEPLPRLNWLGEGLTGTLNHGSAISTLKEVVNLYPSLGLTFEGETPRPISLMDASITYGQILVAAHAINAGPGARLQNTIAQLKSTREIQQPGAGEPGGAPKATDPEPPKGPEEGVDGAAPESTPPPGPAPKPRDPMATLSEANPLQFDLIEDGPPMAPTNPLDTPMAPPGHLEGLAKRSLESIARGMEGPVEGEPEVQPEAPAVPPETVREGGKKKRDSFPQPLPGSDPNEPPQGFAITLARNIKPTWLQRQADRFVFGGLYTRLAKEAGDVFDALGASLGREKSLREAAALWVAYGKGKGHNLADVLEQLTRAGETIRDQERQMGVQESNIRDKAREIEGLSRDIKDLEDQVKRLREQNRVHEMNYEKMGGDWQAAVKARDQYARTVDELQKRLEAQRELMEDLRTTLTRLETAEGSNGEMAAPSARVAELMENVRAIMSRENASAQGLENALVEKTEELQETLDILSDYRSQIERLNQERNDALEAQGVSESAYRKLNERIEIIRSKLETAFEDIELSDKVEEDIDLLINGVKDALAATSEARDELAQIREQYETLNREYEEFKVEIQTAAEMARKEIEKRDRRIEALDRNRELKDKEMGKVRNALTAAQQALVANRALADAEASKMTEMEAGLAAAEAQKGELQAQVAPLREKIEELEEYIAGLEKTNAEESLALGRELEAARREKETIDGKLRSKRVEIDDLNGEIKVYQAKLAEATAKIEALNKDLAQKDVEVPGEVLENNRKVEAGLAFGGKPSLENPSSLDPKNPLQEIAWVRLEFSPQGRLTTAEATPAELGLLKGPIEKPLQPDGPGQVVVLRSADGILWVSSTDHLNGKQRTALEDLAQGIGSRLKADPYTVSALTGTEMGPLARDLYHALRDARGTLREVQSTRLQIVKQDGHYRAFHLSTDSSEYLDFKNYLRDHSEKIGIARIESKGEGEGEGPLDEIAVTLHLSELGQAQEIRDVFEAMGKHLAKNVMVNFKDGPSGGGGPAKKAAESSPPESAGRFDPQEVPTTEMDAFPSPPKVPEDMGAPAKTPSSQPPPPKYRVAVPKELKTLKVGELAPAEIRTGESDHREGVPALFERIVEYGELGGATYEGVGRDGPSEDGFGRFIAPDGSLIMLVVDGAGGHSYGREAMKAILDTFGRMIPQGASVAEALMGSQEAIRQLTDGLVQAGKASRYELKNTGAVLSAVRVERALSPGKPNVIRPSSLGDSPIYLIRQVEGQMKVVWSSKEENLGATVVKGLRPDMYQKEFGNIDPELAKRIHPLANRVDRLVTRDLTPLSLNGVRDGEASDLAEFVTMPDGEEALVIKVGDKIVIGTDGLTENAPTDRALAQRASLHQKGQNPAQVYLKDNVRRQLAFEAAQGQLDPENDDVRAPIRLIADQELWVDGNGVVYDAPTGGNPVDHVKSDHAAILILDFNPTDLKTGQQPARPEPDMAPPPPLQVPVPVGAKYPSPVPPSHPSPQDGVRPIASPPPPGLRPKSPVPPPPHTSKKASPPPAAADVKLPKIPPLSKAPGGSPQPPPPPRGSKAPGGSPPPPPPPRRSKAPGGSPPPPPPPRRSKASAGSPPPPPPPRAGQGPSKPPPLPPEARKSKGSPPPPGSQVPPTAPAAPQAQRGKAIPPPLRRPVNGAPDRPSAGPSEPGRRPPPPPSGRIRQAPAPASGDQTYELVDLDAVEDRPTHPSDVHLLGQRIPLAAFATNLPPALQNGILRWGTMAERVSIGQAGAMGKIGTFVDSPTEYRFLLEKRLNFKDMPWVTLVREDFNKPEATLTNRHKSETYWIIGPDGSVPLAVKPGEKALVRDGQSIRIDKHEITLSFIKVAERK